MRKEQDTLPGFEALRGEYCRTRTQTIMKILLDETINLSDEQAGDLSGEYVALICEDRRRRYTHQRVLRELCGYYADTGRHEAARVVNSVLEARNHQAVRLRDLERLSDLGTIPSAHCCYFGGLHEEADRHNDPIDEILEQNIPSAYGSVHKVITDMEAQHERL